MTGAYRVTSAKVLKVESEVIPLDTYLVWREGARGSKRVVQVAKNGILGLVLDEEHLF